MPSFISAILNYCLISNDLAYILCAVSINAILVSLWLASNYNKVVQVLIFVFTLIPNLVFIAHLLIFKCAIYDESYYPLFQSPLNESINFISIRAYYTVPLIIVCLILFYLLLKVNPKKNINFLFLRVLVLVLSFTPFIYTYAHFLNGNFHYYRGYSIEADFYSSIIDFKNELNKINQFAIKSKTLKQNKINPSYPNIVIIIGESTTSKHFNLFGYYRNTSPHVTNNKNLVIREALTPHAHTIESLTSILKFNTDENLIQKLNSIGYKTIWLSNQKPFGLFESQITAMSNSCDTSVFINNNIKSFNENFDEALIPYLKNELKNNKQKVIFVHLMGTHEPYKKRYPKSFQVFNETPFQKIAQNNILKQSTINEYDNALLYQDSVLNEIFKLTSINNNIATLYFSDHGEEVYNTIDTQGHSEEIKSEAMMNVPFIFYSNCKTDTIFIKQQGSIKLENLDDFIFKSLLLND